jgi:hypothetical protein
MLIRHDEVRKFVKHEALECLAPGHNLWSHQRKRSKGASTAKLHFRVLHFQVWKKLTVGGCDMREITLCLAFGHNQWTYGINVRPCGCNPMVLVNWEFDRRAIVSPHS